MKTFSIGWTGEHELVDSACEALALVEVHGLHAHGKVLTARYPLSGCCCHTDPAPSKEIQCFD